MADRRVRVVLEAAVASYRRGMDQASQVTRRFGDRVLDNEQTVRRAGMAMAAMGTAGLVAMRQMSQESIQFESTLTSMRTQIGLTRDETDQMGQAALGLAHTGRGPQELGDALWFAGSAGQRGATAIATVEAAAKAASIGLGETGTIVDLVTSAMNAYGAEVLSAEAATDVLVGTVRAGKAEAPQLAQSMGMVLPVASEMGVRFDEVGAAIAAMTRTGTDAGTAAMQLRQILAALLNPAQGVQQAMEEMGLSADGVRRTIREDGLWRAMMDLRDATDGNDEALGRLFPNVRALAGFLDLTGANARENAQVFADLSDSTGLLAEGFDDWGTSAEASQARFSASAEAARIAFGEATVGARTFLLDVGTDLMTWFTELSPEAQRTAGMVTTVGSAFLTAGGLGLVALPQLIRMKRTIADLGGMAGIARTGLSGLATFLSNPFTIAVAGATAMLVAHAKRQAEIAASAERLTRTLENQGQTVRENTREWLFNELRQRDVLSAMHDAGLTMRDITLALEGNSDAQAKVNDAIKSGVFAYGDMLAMLPGFRSESRDLSVTLEDLIDAHERHREAAMFDMPTSDFEVHGQAVSGLASVTVGLARNTDDAADSQGDLAENTATATEMMQEQNRVIQEMSDPVLRAIGAAERHAEAQEAVNEAAEEYGKGSPEHQQALRDEWIATRDLDGAHRDLKGALQDNIGLRDDFAAFTEFLMERYGLSREAAEHLIDELDLLGETVKGLPDVKTILIDIDTEQALARLTTVAGHISGLQGVTVGVNISDPPPADVGDIVQHAGGPAGSSGARRVSGRMRHDEFRTILQKGERVFTPTQMKAAGRPAAGGSVTVINQHDWSGAFPNYVGTRQELVDTVMDGMARVAHDNAGVG